MTVRDVLNKKIAREMSEDELQKNVIDMAHAFGWRVAHFRSVRVTRDGGTFYWATPYQGDDGCPDLILARRGVTMLAELKRESRKPDPDQQAWLDASGGWYWRPSDWLSGRIEEALK